MVTLKHEALRVLLSQVRGGAVSRDAFGRAWRKAHALDDFTTAYIEALLWSTNDESDESGGVPLDENYGLEDLSLEALATVCRDCARFQRDNAEALKLAGFLGDYYHKQWTPEEMAGHDFWLTRNGHGVGFWDRNLGKIGEHLSEAARAFGEQWPGVGDDGQIYID